MITLLQKQQDYFDARLADGIALGEAKGKRETQIANAKAALHLGLSVAETAAITGLSLDEVTELRYSLSRVH